MTSGLLGDVRFAIRQLRRAPGYALTVGLTVALAVGSVAALTSVLRATLWSQLPFQDADRLLVIRDVNLRDRSAGTDLVSMARFADVQALQQDGKPVMASVANLFLQPSAIALTGQELHAVHEAGVSDDFFQTVGAPPMLGRTLRAADNVRGSPLHVVISYGLWKSEFAADPAVVGRAVRLGEEQGTIVGVMGRAFAYPVGVEVWAPGYVQPSAFGSYRGEGSRYLEVVARVGPGQTVGSAQASLQALASRLASQYPTTDAEWGFTTVSMRDALFGSYRQALQLAGLAIGVLLLVVLLNLSSLQVTRSVARQPEFNVRTALGVTESRLLRQMLTEHAVLLGLAGLAGLGLASLFLRVVLSQVPRGLLAVGTPQLDWATVGVMFGFCVLVSVLASLVSWRWTLRGREARLAGGSTTRVSPARVVRVGRTLAVCQVASAFVLLALSASVLNELYRLLRAPLGFTTAHVTTFTVDKGWNGDKPKVHQFYEEVEDRLRALPGVEGVGAMTALPLTPFQVRTNFDVQGRPLTRDHNLGNAEARGISAGLFSAMQVPLLAGRPLAAHDGDENVPPVALVNQAFARRYFQGSDAIGQRLLISRGVNATLEPTEIVGVVGNMLGSGGPLTDAPLPELYFAENGGWPHMQFAVRSTGGQADMESAVRAIVASLDPSATIGSVVKLQETVRGAEQQPLLNAELLTLFAGFGLVLVMIGVYGLAAFNLSQRVREFAVRMALGSSREAVFGLMLRDAVRVLLWGLPVGALGAFLCMRAVRAATLYGTAALPGWAYLAAAAVLLLSALAASLHPARRAASLQPMEALRAE